MSYIGVFDSGLGGLTILKELVKKFPKESFTYIADTQNIPYGDKNYAQLKKILQQNLNYLNDAKIIIVACNTLSSILDKLPADNRSLTIGIIDSLVESLLKQKPTVNIVGILATSFTVKSEIYKKKIMDQNSLIKIQQQEAPLLVPAIEYGTKIEQEEVVKSYMEHFNQKIEGLILGCTHYNIIYNKIKNMYPSIRIIDPYREIVNKLEKKLTCFPEALEQKKNRYLTTAYSEELQNRSEEIMQQTINWEVISL